MGTLCRAPEFPLVIFPGGTDGMRKGGTRARTGRRLIAGAVLLAGTGALLAGCSGIVYPPTYTQEELKTICQRRGGWWRGDLIPGYCEYQAASVQAP
ncbi:MAG TPA: hypothetical protein VMS64_22895 [Candidatus Methylomirabilis sp.]|nr:hypothetical protein [Candidatus Methylomirabilis sp.]